MPTWNGKTNYIIGADLTSTSSFSLGTVPTDGEIVILDNDRFSGLFTVGFAAGLDLHAFRIFSNRTSTVFADGAPLTFVADEIAHFGSCPFYYYAESDTQYEHTDYILVDSDNQINAMQINSDGNYNRVMRIIAKKGKVNVSSTCGDIDFVQVSHRNAIGTDAFIEFASSDFEIGELDIAGGIVDCERAVELAVQSAGHYTQDLAAASNLKITGGECVYNHTSMPQAMIHAGTLDLLQNTKYKTGNVYQFKRGVLRKNDTLHDLTIYDMGDTSRI